MIIGLGLDIVEIERIRKALERFGNRFLEKFLTPAEVMAMPKNRIPYIAGRFAVKEAASKALGSGFSQGINPLQFETWQMPEGLPMLRFTGNALLRANKMGAACAHVSITHERNVAAAVVILEGRDYVK